MKLQGIWGYSGNTAVSDPEANERNALVEYLDRVVLALIDLF